MIVNMYVDHLMATPPASAEEVWNATRVHSKLFTDAARRIGLSASDYNEFRGALLDGKAVYVRLPRRMDAMSGSRRGSVYSVRNAVMTSSIMGWRVALADGTTVYVPQVCGNLSLLRPAHIAKAPARHTPVAVHRAPFHPAVAVVPKEQPVAMVAPEQEVPVQIPQVPATIAQVVPVASGGSGFLYFIPAILGGAIAAITHNGPNNGPPVPPPCINGSNSFGVCTAK
ncbi:MAG: hypothetical protein NVSMB19_23040 [Vulcanimicrobiaceae bacterium]